MPEDRGFRAARMMGIVALIGGDEFRPNCVPMDEALLRLTRRGTPRVVIVPTAAAHQGPHTAAENGMRYFASLGADADVAMVLTRADADDPRQTERLADADVVYLTGGDPRHLLDTLQHSAFWDAVAGVFGRGGMVAGSSAGAMALGGWMRRGHAEWVPALGLAPHVAVLPHHEHAAPANVAPLRAALDASIVILGIPTATACVSENGNGWQVLGMSAASVYRQHDTAAFPPGRAFRLS
ncbi:MAG: Type 1 glutamine amidotransferase-like domain-containing protein [Ktedonobacterales bacterium]